MTALLGISAFYHDAAAVIVVDGVIVAAAQEERFSRIKHDASFPAQAVECCLQKANLLPEEIDYVGFYEKPWLKLERLLENYLDVAPRGLGSFLKSMPVWLRRKLHMNSVLRKALNNRYQRRLIYVEHHQSHAASAFFPSPFDQAAVVTVDGVGEWATASIGQGHGNQVELLQEMQYPHSLGLLYSAFTHYCGFQVNSGEYKLMGLAPLGKPVYSELILDKIVDLKPDGSIRLNMKYFDYQAGLRMTSDKFHQLFNGPPRRPDSVLDQKFRDIAASIQEVTELVMLNLARHAHQLTGHENLCLAGGVALNSAANGRILRESKFKNVWVQPASGDAGGALGVALLMWYQLLENRRESDTTDKQQGSLLGPAFTEGAVTTFLDSRNVAYEAFDDRAQLVQQVAAAIADQKVVGWFQGQMEFGPRALGNRSILADARNSQMQAIINGRIKHRESFRPFAPAILQTAVAGHFDVNAGFESPYMAFVVKAHPQTSASFPATTHVDQTSRVQTVDEHRNPVFFDLLKEFERQTGSPILLNTSFNVRGEPIVCTPADAYECFRRTELDLLAIENVLVAKSD